MKTRFAFAGFRHSHILDLLAGIEERPDTELVACCEEDAATRDALADVPLHALTLTIPALLGARHISCVVPGDRKARAVRDTVLGPVSTACPASILQTHRNAFLHIDSAAGSLLDRVKGAE